MTLDSVRSPMYLVVRTLDSVLFVKVKCVQETKGHDREVCGPPHRLADWSLWPLQRVRLHDGENGVWRAVLRAGWLARQDAAGGDKVFGDGLGGQRQSRWVPWILYSNTMCATEGIVGVSNYSQTCYIHVFTVPAKYEIQPFYRESLCIL